MPTRWQRRPLPLRIMLALLALALAIPTPSEGAPARFWLSLSDQAPQALGAPSARLVMGQPRAIYIWAQPRTAGAGEPSALNPLLTLENVSLDLVSPQSTFTINPDSIRVYNPTYSGGTSRFEFTNDSSTGLEATNDLSLLPTGMATGILGIQGFRFNDSAAAGFGSECDAADAYCGSTGGSADAWLFGSFEVTATSDTGSVQFHLQVGQNGMNHVAEDSSDMRVAFGLDAVNPAPAEYDPSLAADRQVTHVNDDPDASFLLVQPGDYDADGDVDQADYDVWRGDFASTLPDADGDTDGAVTAGDYVIWRDHSDAAGSASLRVVPEPTLTPILALPLLVNRRRDQSPPRGPNSFG